MASIQIPPNDESAPRWLLDLHEWRIQPYTEISKEILDSEGYGVVSYTWGYIAQWDKPETDLPKGVVWKVPTTSKWPLSKAREMMQKIGTRYIWWVWMCVQFITFSPMSAGSLKMLSTGIPLFHQFVLLLTFVVSLSAIC
jgi:hypothetical protein